MRNFVSYTDDEVLLIYEIKDAMMGWVCG